MFTTTGLTNDSYYWQKR